MKYPDEALVELAEGKVMIRFMVGKDGYLRNIEAIDTVGVHEALVKEAIRVVSRMPPWEPGINNGVSVDAYCALPINFKINNGWLQRKGIQNDAKKAIRKKARQKRINEEYGIYED
ncbi:MAG: energy transducer TonB [Chitinophagaceae bacterium]|nr:energy transducer TonB [Chitinophagaceae bacterium]